MKTFAMCMVVVLDIEITRVSLDYWSVMTIMYCLTFVVFGKRPTTATATKLSWPEAGKRCWLRQSLYLRLFHAQLGHVLTMWSTSVAM